MPSRSRSDRINAWARWRSCENDFLIQHFFFCAEGRALGPGDLRALYTSRLLDRIEAARWGAGPAPDHRERRHSFRLKFFLPRVHLMPASVHSSSTASLVSGSESERSEDSAASSRASGSRYQGRAARTSQEQQLLTWSRLKMHLAHRKRAADGEATNTRSSRRQRPRRRKGRLPSPIPIEQPPPPLVGLGPLAEHRRTPTEYPQRPDLNDSHVQSTVTRQADFKRMGKRASSLELLSCPSGYYVQHYGKF